MIVVYFAVSHFDKVGRMRGNKFIPFYDDLEQCQEDCRTLKKVLDYYKVSDERDQVHMLTDDPSE